MKKYLLLFGFLLGTAFVVRAAILPAQLQPFSLAGSGVTSGGTTVILSSMKDIGGTNLAMASFGDKGYGTIEPGSKSHEEQISFTGITQNSNGTASLTGVKHVLFLSPYTETSGVAQSHQGGAVFVITNTSGFYNTFANKQNNETITGNWSFSNPVGTTSSPVTLNYATSTFVDFSSNQTITGIKTFSASPIVPEPTTASQAASKNYADNTAKQGAATSTNTVAGISKLSVAATVVTNPIVVGDNDPRMSSGSYNGNYYVTQTVASTSNDGLVATSTVSVDSSKNVFDVYFTTASSSDAVMYMYFNNRDNTLYYSNFTINNGTNNAESNATSSIIANNCSLNVPIYVHMTVYNIAGKFKKIVGDTICGNTIFDYSHFSTNWATTTPISSISFTPNILSTANTKLASTSIMVYQK